MPLYSFCGRIGGVMVSVLAINVCIDRWFDHYSAKPTNFNIGGFDAFGVRIVYPSGV